MWNILTGHPSISLCFSFTSLQVISAVSLFEFVDFIKFNWLNPLVHQIYEISFTINTTRIHLFILVIPLSSRDLERNVDYNYSTYTPNNSRVSHCIRILISSLVCIFLYISHILFLNDHYFFFKFCRI